MKVKNIGTIIATRELHLEDDETNIIKVMIGMPQQFPDSTDYYCPYQITGMKINKIMYAGGVDAVQSIELAIKMIGSELAIINKGSTKN